MAIFPSVPRNVLFMLLAFILNNVAVQLQYSLFASMPVAMSNMFNESFYLHYGSYLSPMGVSTIMSFSTVSGKAGELTAILLVAPLLDRFGRRFVAIHLRFVLLITGSVLTLLATLLPSFECYIASFFFTMVSFEIKFFATTLFIIECTPDSIRGFVTILQSVADVAAGVLSATLARPSVVGTEDKWWQMGALSLLLNILSATYLVWMPETPKRLAAIGRRAEAREALIYYQGEQEDTEEILDSYEKEASVHSSIVSMSWKDAWRDETIRKSIYLILAFYLAINLSPYATEMMYSTITQMMMGLPNETVLTLNSMSRVLAIPLSFPVSLAIERFGRRPIVFITFGILFFKAILMSFGLSLVYFAGPSTTTIGIAIFNDLLSSIVSSMGILIIASLFVCELTPLNARVAVSQICNLVPSVTMIPVTALLPMTLTLFPATIYILPIIALPPLLTYIYRNLPETKGRRVCDIIEDFDYCVRSRAPTRLSMLSVDEHTPLIKRGSLLQ